MGLLMQPSFSAVSRGGGIFPAGDVHETLLYSKLDLTIGETKKAGLKSLVRRWHGGR